LRGGGGKAAGGAFVRVSVTEVDRELGEVTSRIYGELVERERLGFTREPLRRPSGDTSP